MFRLPSTGKTPANIAGRMAKYLATSLAIEKVVSAPRVTSSCLPISTISISLVGLESRSTMLPASRAAWVPVFMATPTSAWASAGASLVPSPVMATRFPPACSRLISSILSSGLASARKSSTPASWAIAPAVSGLSPVIMIVRMPIRRRCSKRSARPSLTMSLSWTIPSGCPLSATASGVPPCCATPPASSVSWWGTVPPASLTSVQIASTAPLRIDRPSKSTPLIRVCAVKGTSRPPCSSRSRRSNLSLASTTIERPSGVSSARLAAWAASASSSSLTPSSGRKAVAARLPSVIVPVLSSSSTAQSPAASTARPDMASTLRRTSRSMPAMPIAESRAPMVVGIRQTSRATRTTVLWRAPE